MSEAPVPADVYEIPQPPKLGLRNPPCCGTPAALLDGRRAGGNKHRYRCGHCGSWLVVTVDDRGRPLWARRAVARVISG